MMYEVCPFGERRADMRAAVMTANVLASQTTASLSASEFRDVVKALSSYLPSSRDDDQLPIDKKVLKDMPNARGHGRPSEG